MTAALTLPLTTETGDAPEPGIYPGVPFEAYKRWPYLNASTLVEGLQSMRRLKAKLDGKLPDSDSDAKRFGRAVHCRLLEPNEFPTRFPIVTKCNAVTAKGTDCRSLGRYLDDAGWWCGVHKPETCWEPTDFITEDEAERIELIKKHAFAHREIQHIRRFGGAEVSIVFDLMGVRCKARLDKLIEAGGGFVVDVKTTSKPLTESQLARTITDLNYHIKAAFYLAAVKEATGLSADFWWVFVETTAPFDVAAIRMTDFDRQVGTWEIRRLLEAYKRCLDTGHWPGAFPELVEHLGLPQWKAKEYQHIDVEDQ